MLSTREREKIEKELKQYEQRSGACIEALKAVQESRGWVSDEAVREIAQFLEMTPEEVDAVATFYNLIFRKPVGRNVLLICDSVSCWVMGCDALRDRVKQRLGIGYGETTPDGSLTLLPNACLGACDRAPVALLGEETYTDLTPEKLEALLSELERKKESA